VRENRRKIAVGIGILVFLLVVTGGIMAWRARQANQAGAMLGKAMAISQAQILPAPTVPGATQVAGTYPTVQARSEAAIEAFTEVVTTYPGTEGALVAQYHIASELLAAGRSAEAEQAFASVAAEARTGVYAASAKLGQAEALMATGRTDDALKIYSDLAAARDGVLPTDGLLMELARASIRAGKTAEARAAFQRVIDEFAESPYVQQAQQQIAAMN
jgi:TolA-binding protein